MTRSQVFLAVTALVSFFPLMLLWSEHSTMPKEAPIMTVQRSTPRQWPLDLDPIEFRYLSHAIIDEKHKLLICAIPKVASSEWKKLFLRFQGDLNWREEPWWKMRNLTTLYKVIMLSCYRWFFVFRPSLSFNAKIQLKFRLACVERWKS